MSNRQPGELAKFFLDGANYLSQHGQWCGQDYHKRTGFFRTRHAYCAVGYAMHKAPRGKRTAAIDMLYEVARLCDHGHGPMWVNDHLGQEACVNMYRESAKLAMARGL